MKSPLESKYCCLEKSIQLDAATSLMLSEKYTKSNRARNNIIWKLAWFLVISAVIVTATWKVNNRASHGSLHSMLCRNGRIPSIGDFGWSSDIVPDWRNLWACSRKNCTSTKEIRVAAFNRRKRQRMERSAPQKTLICAVRTRRHTGKTKIVGDSGYFLLF